MIAVARAGKRLVAVGERGIVLLSDDDARSWRQAAVPVSVSLCAVCFSDERSGWAVGHLGVVLHTVDGGENWSLQLDGVRAARLVLQEAERQGADAKAHASALALIHDGPDKPLLDVHFENAHTGFAIGAYNLVFRTDDGGRTWWPWMSHVDNPKGLHLYAMTAADDGLFIAGEQGLLLRSTDAGAHFATLPTPSKGTFFGTVAAGRGELLVYGLRGRAFHTADGGQNWSEIDTGTRASLAAGIRLTDGRLILASQGGELLISEDGGRRFKVTLIGDSLPITSMVETADGRLAVATLRGVRRVDLSAASSEHGRTATA
jgi:photosystem II stability/assembly factor-like uncharacterized protein